MLGKRTWLVIGIVAVVLIGVGVGILGLNGRHSNEPVLRDYPELFRRDAMIIVGGNASQIELESAAAIAANLAELTGNEPIAKTDAEVSGNDKSDRNLILIGTPNSNNLLQEVCDVTNATEVTKEYPGPTKGILEILANPWNENKALFLITGSDPEGTMNSVLTLIIEEERIGSLAVRSVEVDLLNEAWVSKINSFVRDEILEDALNNPSVDVNVIFSHKPTLNEARELEDLGIVLDLDEWSQPMELTTSGACPARIPTNRLSEAVNLDYVVQISRW